LAITCRPYQGWQKLPENKYEPLKIALVTRGPVAVAVAAKGWEMYVSGIYSDCQPDVATGHTGPWSNWADVGGRLQVDSDFRPSFRPPKRGKRGIFRPGYIHKEHVCRGLKPRDALASGKVRLFDRQSCNAMLWKITILDNQVNFLVGGLEHEFYDFPNSWDEDPICQSDFHIFQRGQLIISYESL